MNRINIILLFLAGCLLIGNAAAQENPLNKLSFLVENSWEVKGNWINNNQEFRQELEGEWGLNRKIIKLNIYGVVNIETGERGLRNEVVIAYDSFKQEYKYYTFDVHGGITECIIEFEGDKMDIKYKYPISGKERDFRDTWIRKDDDTFYYQIVMSDENNEEVKLLEGKAVKKAD